MQIASPVINSARMRLMKSTLEVEIRGFIFNERGEKININGIENSN